MDGVEEGSPPPTASITELIEEAKLDLQKDMREISAPKKRKKKIPRTLFSSAATGDAGAPADVDNEDGDVENNKENETENGEENMDDEEDEEDDEDESSDESSEDKGRNSINTHGNVILYLVVFTSIELILT